MSNSTTSSDPPTPSYNVKPANSQCISQQPTIVKPVPGSSSYNSEQMFNNANKQQTANTQYDNINSENVKPVSSGDSPQSNSYGMTGGSNDKNDIFVLFKKNEYKFNDNNSNNANNISKIIKIVLNNKIYKEDNLMEIKYNNSISIYIIKGYQKNKFKKIY